MIDEHRPDQAAIEQIFVAKSAASALRLGMARGVGLLVCGINGLAVGEISARAVKKAVAGTGAADKKQVQDMVARLLAVTAKNADAADALAIAIAASNDAGKLADVGIGSGKVKPLPAYPRPLLQQLPVTMSATGATHDCAIAGQLSANRRPADNS